MLARLNTFIGEKTSPLRYRIPLKKVAPYITALIGFAMAVWFFARERDELHDLGGQLGHASPVWIAAGILMTAAYIVLQGLMYRHAFLAAGAGITLADAIVLFLKRNFVSPFLPAGAFVSLGLFTARLEKRRIPRTALHFGSSIYGLLGLLSLGLVAIPVLLWLLAKKSLSGSEMIGFVWVVLSVSALGWVLWSLKNGGNVARILLKIAPGLGATMQEFRTHPFSPREAGWSLVASLGIELTGILHLWIALKALGFAAGWEAATAGYVVGILVMIVSPFLRGLGAVELVMTVVLTQFGLHAGEALAVTLLFRFFEFWSVLAAGAVTFLKSAEGLLLRLMPPLFLFLLGLVNVVSAVTPALPERMRLLRDFLPIDWIHYSNFLVLTSGLVLLLTSVYLFRGLRLAWWVALGLSILSVAGHVGKGFDYEEATLSMLALLALLRTKQQYFIKIDRRKGWFGALVFVATLNAAILYGTLGFYFLDKKMFGFDFTWEQALGSTLRLFFLLDASYLNPLTDFARHFMVSIAFAGMLSILLGLYYLLLPHIVHFGTSSDELEEAAAVVKKFGHSSLDYFKTYFDKQIFFNEKRNAFVAYKVARNYAVVLEKPVSADQPTLRATLRAFETFCRESGLQPVYFRVPESDLGLFGKRKSLQIGQEAWTDVQAFSLQGKDAKPLRNAFNRAEKEGMEFKIYPAPVRMGVLQKCKAVSDAWLAEGRHEIAFSGGIFSYEELRQQTIVTVEDAEERVVAFMNLIPDYAPGEATYDLMRRLPDTPGWVADFLMSNLLLHLRNAGYRRLNLGLAPLAGLGGSSLPERTLLFAYNRVKVFAHYQGMRAFKEKFAHIWENRYLVYSSDADLLAMPQVLTKVEKI